MKMVSKCNMGCSWLIVSTAFGFVFATAANARGQTNSQQETKPVSLWAGISVSQAIFSEAQTKTLQVSFALVNDGASTVNPRIGASHLSINGVEPKDWLIVINNGLRSPEFERLPPGHVLSFGYMLGERYFPKSGVYTVRWWGDEFKAAAITFRVLADNRLN